MPWDCFCPKCTAVCEAGMTEDPEEMEKEIAKFRGKQITCLSCGCIFSFDTGEIEEAE